MAELKALPLNGMANSNLDIAKHLREQAGWMEEADAASIRNVVLVIEYQDGQIYRQVCGAPMDLARMVGVLTMAAIQKTVS